MKKRIYGAKIDFKIESIQAGYLDCIARREIGKGRFEEISLKAAS